jgi:hypothetical protein
MSDVPATIAPPHADPSRLPSMPRTVQVAVYLCWLNMGLGVAYGATTKITWLLLFGAAVTVTFTLLLTKGYGWVRHLWTFLTLVSLPFIVRAVSAWFAISWAASLVSILGNVCVLTALSMLYSRSARAWFRQARARRRDGL